MKLLKMDKIGKIIEKVIYMKIFFHWLWKAVVIQERPWFPHVNRIKMGMGMEEKVWTFYREIRKIQKIHLIFMYLDH